TADEYQLALKTLNRMIDRWNLNDLLVYSTNPHTFPFVPGKQAYTLGATGDFDMPRPSRIERISIQYGDPAMPIELGIDADFDLEAWQNLVVKKTPSVFPLACYNNTGYPFMELNFWPVPSGPANVILYTWDLMPFIVSLADTIDLPTGYSDAIVYNLAIRLAQLFDRVPSPSLVQEAKQAIHDINDINDSTPTIHYDAMFHGNGNGNIAAKSIGYTIF
ncbi:MAG: hypothetical protein JHC33_07980, partial [Ignisphaera sp.]|nr:hypothetical protein [Ignisphaera sp.]